MERLAPHRLQIVRVGHPARVLPSVVDHTLDVITRTCDSGQIVADVRKEMDETLVNIRKSKNRSERRNLSREGKQTLRFLISFHRSTKC